MKFSNVKQPTKKHNCNLILQQRYGWKCDVCNKSNPSKFSMYCKSNDFDMCTECYFKETNEQPQNSGQQSIYSPDENNIHSHPLTIDPLNSIITCDICKKEPSIGMIYSCRKCNLDFCEECFKRIISIAQPNPKHQCILVAVKSNFICNECKK